MTRLLDLDKLGPQDIEVVKDGTSYLLPGDPPSRVWLAFVNAADKFEQAEGDENEPAMLEFEARCLDLFKIRQPDIAELPFGVVGVYQVLAGIYSTTLDDQEGGANPPKATAKANGRVGTPSSSRRKTTRSRSSKS